MVDTETRSLRRTALLLLAVSLARWSWGHRPVAADGLPGGDALPELLDSTRGAVSEAERRSLPLENGERIDANRASAEELDRLPGIGPSTARAIVDERERRGGFGRVEELLDVRGVGLATLARVEPFVTLGPVSRGPSGARAPTRASRRGPNPPIDINRADEAALQTLPGIGPALARRIVAARREQVFRSVEDLERVSGIGPAKIDALRELVTAASIRSRR